MQKEKKNCNYLNFRVKNRACKFLSWSSLWGMTPGCALAAGHSTVAAGTSPPQRPSARSSRPRDAGDRPQTQLARGALPGSGGCRGHGTACPSASTSSLQPSAACSRGALKPGNQFVHARSVIIV